MARPILARSWYVLTAFATLALAAGEPERGLDVVRPTVQLRNGEKRGSGTIIASVAGDTLILTAAHVVKGASDLTVELHRHNLGFSSTGLTEGGGWPRLVKAKVVAADPDSDVALLRVGGMVALPHVARFDPSATLPARGDVLTSVGIDRTLFLTRWQTSAQGTAMIDIHQGDGGPRPFTVVTRYPEHGRSGGGLYRSDGAVVGVCTGQLSLKPGTPKVGVFASVVSIRRLLEGQGLVKTAVTPAGKP
jgi:S1-C subfamily serine protease